MRRLAAALWAVALCVSLAACKDRQAGAAAAGTAANGEATLPAPANTQGSVTGMPPPGAAGTRPADAAPTPDTTMPPPVEAVDGVPIAAEPAPPPPTDASDDPTVEEAVQAIRDYYAAINNRDYARAYSLWSAGANPQSQAQFADGFGDTLGVSVDIGAPGQVEGAAGSRYIDIPVTLSASQRDGSTRRFAGRYSLRAVMADGATPEQRRWHVSGASLHELH